MLKSMNSFCREANWKKWKKYMGHLFFLLLIKSSLVSVSTLSSLDNVLFLAGAVLTTTLGCACTVFLPSLSPTHSFFPPAHPRVSLSVAWGQPEPLGVLELHWARSRERLCRRQRHPDPWHPLPVHTRLLCSCTIRPAVRQGNRLPHWHFNILFMQPAMEKNIPFHSWLAPSIFCRQNTFIIYAVDQQ